MSFCIKWHLLMSLELFSHKKLYQTAPVLSSMTVHSVLNVGHSQRKSVTLGMVRHWSIGENHVSVFQFSFFSFRGQEVKLINRRHLILAIQSIKNLHSHVSHLLARCLRQPLQQTEVDPVHLVTQCHIAPILLSLMANSCE